MSTQDKADKDWDDYIKKSLEKPNLPFDPRAWQAMEKKLDRRLAWRNTYRRGFFSLLALLFISTGVWYGLTESGRSREGEKREEALATHQSSTDGAKQNARVNTEKIDRQIGESITPTASNSYPQMEAEVKSEPLKTKTKSNATSYTNEKGNENGDEHHLKAKKSTDLKVEENNDYPNSSHLAKSRQPSFKFGKQALITKDEAEKENTTFRTDISTANGKQKTASDIKGISRTVETNNEVANLPSNLSIQGNEKGEGKAYEQDKITSSKTLPWSSQQGPQTQDEREEATELAIRTFQFGNFGDEASLKEWPAQHSGIRDLSQVSADTSLAKRRSLPNFGKWSLNIVLAPDLSTVGFGNFTTPGMSQGLGLEYQISPRIGVQLSALYSSKVYFAGPDDYQPIKPWQYGKPERIDGNCKVLDLPLNLRYKALLKEKYALYVSTGLSSYLMRSEKYEYIYPGYPNSKWSAPTRNNHWFGVVNMSLGYERKLSRRFSLQVEPYVKVPLAGVGAGKVKLVTTGAFFVLKYHMGK